ncbi:hypothetical protein LCGC14_2714470 [marine sediment metagenome]|uniref:Uncharacterized protein n=1 Tax=marine sediment metagenome TaxID=412755 RepID=A0A0F9BL08_9ZZZZ
MRIRRMTTAQLINLVSEQAPGNRYRRMIDDSSRIEVLGSFVCFGIRSGAPYILLRLVNNYHRNRQVTLICVTETKTTETGILVRKTVPPVLWNEWTPDYPSTLPRKTIDRMVARSACRVAREEARCGTT